MKVITPNPEHEVVFQDIVTMLQRHAAKGVSKPEVLAIAANVVGKLVAMQDQREMTPAMAMEIVSLNMRLGNQQVVAEISNTKGNA